MREHSQKTPLIDHTRSFLKSDRSFKNLTMTERELSKKKMSADPRILSHAAIKASEELSKTNMALDAGLLQKNYDYLSKMRATDRKMKFKGGSVDFRITTAEKTQEREHDMLVAKNLTLNTML